MDASPLGSQFLLFPSLLGPQPKQRGFFMVQCLEGDNVAEPKAYKARLADFKPDQNNLNRHTQRGQRLVENSQRQRGFGRPGFAAKDGTVLGGNLSVMEVATDIGLGDGEVFVIETDGDIPILHLRRDVAPDSETAALLAAEDNHSALKSINYDPEILLAEIERGIEFGGIFEADEIKEILGELGGEPKDDQWGGMFNGLPNGEKSPYMQMTFTLHDTQVQQVKDALTLAKQLGGFDYENNNSNGNALTRICETFSTNGQS
jgi:hypothetical protein